MEDISVNTLIEKMTKGGDAKRNAKRADGSSSSQSYKMGGWTASKKKK